ncbi:MAG: transposase, partial [Candidatus Nanohaloarchaea archaeon]|nr:transposase [Candidatus Nanohaloarchaea archaeon]
MEDFLPSEERCAEVLRAVRWNDGIYCLYCSSEKVVKNGLRPDHIQQYRCKACGKAFNDRTMTILSHTQMKLPEAFYALKQFKENRSINQISKDLDRHWKTVNNLLKKAMASINPFKIVEKLQGDVEIDEVYINAGNKGTRQEKPRKRGSKMRGRGTY